MSLSSIFFFFFHRVCSVLPFLFFFFSPWALAQTISSIRPSRQTEALSLELLQNSLTLFSLAELQLQLHIGLSSLLSSLYDSKLPTKCVEIGDNVRFLSSWVLWVLDCWVFWWWRGGGRSLGWVQWFVGVGLGWDQVVVIAGCGWFNLVGFVFLGSPICGFSICWLFFWLLLAVIDEIWVVWSGFFFLGYIHMGLCLMWMWVWWLWWWCHYGGGWFWVMVWWLWEGEDTETEKKRERK